MNKVGVRELRQNLSVYLRRVAKGELLQVTEHGSPVALLIPIPRGSSIVDTLTATGRLRPAGSAISSITPPRGPVSRRLSDALMADREDRL